MMRIFKEIAITAAIWLVSLGVTHAQIDPFTEAALDAFRQTITTNPQQPAQQSVATALEQQAKYLMWVKNGLSLYRDGALQAADKNTLAKLVEQQLAVSSLAMGSPQLSANQEVLAIQMHKASLAAKKLLRLAPNAPHFAALMDSYHNGTGYDAYRQAQDLGIEQYWMEAPM